MITATVIKTELLRKAILTRTRPNIWTFQNLKICQSTCLSCLEFVARRILRLWNCEMLDRAEAVYLSNSVPIGICRFSEENENPH